jgi:Glycosyltransferase like family
MIAFGTSITGPELYERWAKPGVERAAEPDSPVFAVQAAGSIFRSYNLILDRAAALDGLEALVLVHQDAEIIDPDLPGKVRAALRDPDVAVVGAVGATGVRSIAWWEGEVTRSPAVYRYGDLGGGDMPIAALDGGGRRAPGEVETVDGVVMALSPWAVRTVRFDESLGLLFGYDLDYCLQVRAAGRKVVAADLAVAHHHSLDLVLEPERWVAAHMRVAEKWDDGPAAAPDTEDHAAYWRGRARRAEAEAGAARLLASSRELQANARAQRNQRALEHVAHSASWRLTQPLRRLNVRLTAARRRQG